VTIESSNSEADSVFVTIDIKNFHILFLIGLTEKYCDNLFMIVPKDQCIR
jgi:hypothetical protein